MKRKKWKGSKAILPLLLSAMMVVEPIGTVTTVHAEEMSPSTVIESQGQDEDAVEDESLVDNTDEDAGENTGDGIEPGDSVQESEEDSKTETEDEYSDSTDKEDQSSENPSDTEDQETGDDVSEEEDTISGNELEEDTVSGNDLDEEEKEDQDSDTEQFSDMPSYYQLSATQRLDKEVLAGEVGNINEADEGILYAKGELMVAADSQEEAEMIAEAYNAEIKGFDNGLLLLELQKGNTVASAVRAAASTRNRLPAVWPNYYRYAYVEESAAEVDADVIELEETEYEYEVEEGAEAEYAEEEDVPSIEAYERAIASYNDPALSANSEQYQWQHVAVGSPYAWAEGYTGAGVKVAILDTGVMASHNELTIVDEADATRATVVTGSGSASDTGGHGTHVAGIVGAKAGNAAGGAGIAPDAELYGIRVLGGDGEYANTDWAIAQGIYQAMKWNVDIINMSLGGPGYNQLGQDAVTDAYNQGVAIFVSAGNDGATCINYPAHYDHVICVAATDQNNSRADFSTYGSWVDLSAPGVSIWSTYYDGGYTSMSGTSMACPVAAGEAAVILGGDTSLQEMAKNGKKVDALEKKMKSNAVKAAGSGMGSGVTSLTKVFNLSAAATKPQAPVIEIEPDNQSQAQKVKVTIKAQSGMRIYYTDNGKNPTYKNGLADANTMLYAQPFEIKNNANGTIKAIAVNESGVASAVKSVKYTLKPYVSDVEISGVQQVAPGKSIQLSAEVFPAYATNKQVTWALYTASGVEVTAADAISINAKGKITAKANATVGATYIARATAKGVAANSNVYDEYTITVIAVTKISSAKFTQKSVTLNLPDDQSYDLAQIFTATSVDETDASVANFKWSSNNKSVATVDGNGVVRPYKAGKVTITALANDSSGKKASCTITVKQYVTDIQISGASSVAAGKSVAYKATIAPSDATVKKVTWSVVDEATGQEPTAVKINAKNGKLTATAAATGSYIVKATSTDEKGSFGNKKIVIKDGAIKSIAFEKAADKKVTIFRKKAVPETVTSRTINVNIEGTTAGADLDAYEVTSSNPGIATASASRADGVIALTITATGRSAGKTNVILASTDGSNKKVTCAVTVNNPATKVHISSNTKTMSGGSIDMIAIKGKSLQLKATLESEYGAISNKGVKWSINAPDQITINKSGKVSVSKNIGDEYLYTSANHWIYTVTAEASDGSGAKGTYSIAVMSPATYVTVPTLTPRPGRVWALNPMPNIDGMQDFISAPISTDIEAGYIEATSSNPQALEVLAYYNQNKGQYYLYMTAHAVKKDTMVTVTVKATDGSGKKSSYKILVTNSRL